MSTDADPESWELVEKEDAEAADDVDPSKAKKKKKRSKKKTTGAASDNERLYAGSPFFDVVRDATVGRRAVASHHKGLAVPGALVLSEHPFAFIVPSALAASHCAGCCRKVGAGASSVGSGVACSELCAARQRGVAEAARLCHEAIGAVAAEHDCEADLLLLVVQLITVTLLPASGDLTPRGAGVEGCAEGGG